MSIKVWPYIIILLLSLSCSSDQDFKPISFYHWRSNAEYLDSYKKVLTDSHTKKIYLHYFDIDKIETSELGVDEIYPIYVIQSIEEKFKDYEIIPVVYIANRVFLTNELNLEKLSTRIVQLTNQISLNYFDTRSLKIQIDCDWSQSTQALYFTLLDSLKNHFDIDVTIRLHQIKFQEVTGIPPVDNGTLMLYNIGDLKNKQQNSIIEDDIVKQYVNLKTNYPISLKLALPIFSQSILTNNQGEIKIIKNSVRTELEDDEHFIKINENNFQVVKDTLFKGFYLSEGFNVKLEEVNELEVIKAYHTIKNSELKIDEIIFYHLDKQSIYSVDLKKIIQEL